MIDKNFVFTGTLTKFNRNDAKKMVESLGANASNNVSKKTDYLVTGENAGSKIEKAKNLNITIISETEFLNLLK